MYKRQSLTSLNLRSNNLGAEGAKALAEGVAVSTSLTSLNLKYNDLGDEGWCAVFDTLRDNPQNKIKEWDLARQGINPKIAKSLAAYVAVSPSLTDLSVADNNNLGPEGAQAIAEGVKASKSLKKLDMSNGGGHSSGDIKAEGTKYIADALRVSGSLTSINLCDNNISAEGAKAMCDALSANDSLTRLDVSFNMLDRGGNGVQLLRDAVRGRDGFVLIDNNND